MTPLASWVLLRPDDEAPCHLKGSRGARHTGEPGVRVWLSEKVTAGLRCWERPSEAWWHTDKGGIGFIGGAKEAVHALTFSLDTLTSNYN